MNGLDHGMVAHIFYLFFLPISVIMVDMQENLNHLSSGSNHCVWQWPLLEMVALRRQPKLQLWETCFPFQYLCVSLCLYGL